MRHGATVAIEGPAGWFGGARSLFGTRIEVTQGPKGAVPRRSDNYMVEDFNLQKLPGPDQVTRHLNVCLRRLRLAARVIVLCGAQDYVQSRAGSTDANAGSSSKGALLCILILSMEWGCTHPSAC